MNRMAKLFHNILRYVCCCPTSLGNDISIARYAFGQNMSGNLSRCELNCKRFFLISTNPLKTFACKDLAF